MVPLPSQETDNGVVSGFLLDQRGFCLFNQASQNATIR